MVTAKSSIQRRLPDSIIDGGLEESLPIGVQKSYFLLTEPERNLLNLALEKYRAGQTDSILVGGQKVLKAALRLAVLADHTKWGVVSLAAFAPVEKIGVLVTDVMLPADAHVALAGRVGEIV